MSTFNMCFVLWQDRFESISPKKALDQGTVSEFHDTAQYFASQDHSVKKNQNLTIRNQLLPVFNSF
jgi:hypothetical protein